MHEFEKLKSELDAAGIDISRLALKPIVSNWGGERPDDPPLYPIFCLPGASQDAMTLWEKLNSLSAQTGYCPVINTQLEYPCEPASWDEATEQSTYPRWEDFLQRIELDIRNAEEFDVNAWFQEQLVEEREKSQKYRPTSTEQLRAAYESPFIQALLKTQLPKLQAELQEKLPMRAIELSKELEIPPFDAVLNAFHHMQEKEGDRWDLSLDSWPDDVEPSDEIATVSHSPKSPLYSPVVYIDLFPAKSSWMLPAFDDFPPANNYWGGAQPIHMAILKRWHTEYGAELAVMSGATYELKVSHPPTTKEEAMKLAVEHYLYCIDCVTQTGLPATIKHRAASILKARSWYFWWD